MVRNFLLILVYAGVIWFDYPNLTKQARPVKLCYAILMLLVFYLALSYVLNANWPNADALVNLVFLRPARAIVEVVDVRQ